MKEIRIGSRGMQMMEEQKCGWIGDGFGEVRW